MMLVYQPVSVYFVKDDKGCLITTVVTYCNLKPIYGSYFTLATAEELLKAGVASPRLHLDRYFSVSLMSESKNSRGEAVEVQHL